MRNNPKAAPILNLIATKMSVIHRDFFSRSVHAVAPELIGATFLLDGVGGRIVEVEAYEETDPASHSFGGPRGRNVVMFGPAGHLYVYRSYGIHWCANIVCGTPAHGAAVLLRALEPTHGLDEMRARRGPVADRLLCAGPGRLTQALGLTGADNGARLEPPRFSLVPPDRTSRITRTPRIGITRATELDWRYVEAGTSWSSRPVRRAA